MKKFYYIGNMADDVKITYSNICQNEQELNIRSSYINSDWRKFGEIPNKFTKVKYLGITRDKTTKNSIFEAYNEKMGIVRIELAPLGVDYLLRYFFENICSNNDLVFELKLYRSSVLLVPLNSKVKIPKNINYKNN